jgi:hypothetical protein
LAASVLTGEHPLGERSLAVCASYQPAHGDRVSEDRGHAEMARWLKLFPPLEFLQIAETVK